MLQAKRLGSHLAGRVDSIGPVTHVFSSDLQRASMTAKAVLDAQKELASAAAQAPENVVRLAELRERDFRSSEGTKFGVRVDAGAGGSRHADAETSDEMQVRIHRFLSEHLVPVLEHTPSDVTGERSVVVVAHGIILNVLLRALLSRFSPLELLKLSDPKGTGTSVRTEYLASWSNTGYLEASIQQPVPVEDLPSTASDVGGFVPLPDSNPSDCQIRTKLRLTVGKVNCLEHIQGLKKTRGGIGSAKFDGKQKTMDSFFASASKKRKPDDDTR